MEGAGLVREAAKKRWNAGPHSRGSGGMAQGPPMVHLLRPGAPVTGPPLARPSGRRQSPKAVVMVLLESARGFGLGLMSVYVAPPPSPAPLWAPSVGDAMRTALSDGSLRNARPSKTAERSVAAVYGCGNGIREGGTWPQYCVWVAQVHGQQTGVGRAGGCGHGCVGGYPVFSDLGESVPRRAGVWVGVGQWVGGFVLGLENPKPHPSP